ncbi:Transmembrane protein [Parasponia andersonii]|uniref:Transmembrane protein n=1 Tax=Parasponia andersonii TaxID=3476 RepID=A0A2P5AXQ2_PARAD|nr:Transmembrane protein [Parasponia andersonii]
MSIPLNIDIATASSSDTAPQINIDTTTQINIAYRDFDYYIPLYKAALQGNWESAKQFLENDPKAATAVINRFQMTALHVAAGEGQSVFVENLVDFLPAEALGVQDRVGLTALHYAAITGSLRAAVALVSKNSALTNVLDPHGRTPLLVAARYVYECNYDVLWYLAMMTSDEEPSCPFTGPHATDLVKGLLWSGSLDIILYIIDRYPSLATATTAMGSCLPNLLSLTPSNFLSGNRLGVWESCVYSVIPVQKSYGPPYSVRSIMKDVHEQGPIPKRHVVLRRLQRLVFTVFTQLTPSSIKRLQEAKHRHQCAVELFKQLCTRITAMHGSLTEYFLKMDKVQFQAASLGIVEILRIMYQLCPDLLWNSVGDDYSPIRAAIKNRQENIFCLFCEKNARNKLQCDSGGSSSESILYLAATLAPQHSNVSGAALQMQREMKWFKEVEKLVHPFSQIDNVKRGKTARELFTELHKDLAAAGEKWMKETSSSFLIVSTLIATVVFTAAFTVPGGNDDDGVPNFLKTDAFLVFAMSDALSLFSSLTSILMFLSILTARYTEEDFTYSLPKRLIIGLASLFLAITTLMVAFGATLSIVLDQRLKWISAPTVLLALVPVAIFTSLELPLFMEMVRSTFGFNFIPQSPW